MRAGEAAGAEPELAQQRVDHPRRRRLAVGAGEVDDGHGALRRAQQVHQGVDAVREGSSRLSGQRAAQLLLDPGQAAVLLLLILPRMPVGHFLGLRHMVTDTAPRT